MAPRNSLNVGIALRLLPLCRVVIRGYRVHEPLHRRLRCQGRLAEERRVRDRFRRLDDSLNPGTRVISQGRLNLVRHAPRGDRPRDPLGLDQINQSFELVLGFGTW